MDVGFWATRDELYRRVRAVMRDDIDGIGCVLWLDLVDWPRRGQPNWPERAGEFNAILTELGRQYGVHVPRWSNYVLGHRDWFRSDGVHLRLRGQRAFARFVADRVDHFC